MGLRWGEVKWVKRSGWRTWGVRRGGGGSEERGVEGGNKDGYGKGEIKRGGREGKIW